MIYNGDCLEILKTLADNSVDSMVTDPPAGIAFMGKGWDDDKGGRDQWITWMKEIMTECKRVMKPGAHGLIWALPRTSHWTATALEDAGFEVRDVVNHVFGSGFPKSLNVSKAIDGHFFNLFLKNNPDKKLKLDSLWDVSKEKYEEYEKELRRESGTEREVVGTKTEHNIKGSGENSRLQNSSGKRETIEIEITIPSTPEAKQWDGFGTALKPAHENWVLVRKPIECKTVAENVLEWGCGGINIDQSRIGNEPVPCQVSSTGSGYNQFDSSDYPGKRIYSTQGRFPANFILTEGVAVEELDRQSGQLHLRGNKKETTRGGGMYGHDTFQGIGLSESGYSGASRFFKNIESEIPFIYQAKASKKDKNEGLDCIEIINISYVTWENVDLKVQLQVDTGVYPPKVIGVSGMSLNSVTEWNTFLFGKSTSDLLLENSKSIIKMETRSTIESKTLSWLLHSNTNVSIQDANSLMVNGGSLVDHARSLNMFQNTIKEKTDFVTNANNAQSNEYLKITIEKKASNIHPTCKNTKLMSYLITLVTPPGGVVLDPFLGSGSTGVAAIRDGFNFIGIEKEPEYFEISKARIDYELNKQNEDKEKQSEFLLKEM